MEKNKRQRWDVHNLPPSDTWFIHSFYIPNSGHWTTPLQQLLSVAHVHSVHSLQTILLLCWKPVGVDLLKVAFDYETKEVSLMSSPISSRPGVLVFFSSCFVVNATSLREAVICASSQIYYSVGLIYSVIFIISFSFKYSQSMILKCPVFLLGPVWTPPSLLSWLAAVFIDTDGGLRTSSRTEADKEGMSFSMLHSLSPKTHVLGPYIHPSATQSSIPPSPGVPQFITPTLIYPSMPHIDPHLGAPTKSYSSLQST